MPRFHSKLEKSPDEVEDVKDDRHGPLASRLTLTNVGTDPITLPVSVGQNIDNKFSVLTLWLTSDPIKAQYTRDKQTGRLFKVQIVKTSAELYGDSTDPLAVDSPSISS